MGDIYKPPLNFSAPGTQYGRVVQLRYGRSARGTLLATAEKAGLDGGVSTLSFPIFASSDEGASWERISDVTTGVNKGMRWQPNLLELPRRVGKLDAGTVLCTGLSIDLLTPVHFALKVFASTDGGRSWAFLSNIAQGSASSKDAHLQVWEPHLMLNRAGQLTAVYSDERARNQHSQMLVQQVSEDGGLTWGPVVRIVALPDQSQRPGMAVVSRLGSGDYFMTYELCCGAGNPVYYKLSTDGIDWGNSSLPGTKLMSVDGVTPGASPYNVWSPNGGPNGTLVVSAEFQTPASERGSHFFVSHDHARTWTRLVQPLPYALPRTGYSQGLAVGLDHGTLYAVNNVNYRDDVGLAMLAFASVKL